MTAWTGTVAALSAAGLPHILIGGLALGAHGHARATRDADLLAPLGALDDAVWAPLRAEGASVDLRRGEPGDPLVGVVRVRRRSGAPTDVVVLGRWTDAMYDRASPPVVLRGAPVRVVDAADLILLKLYADGPVDRADVAALLGLDPGLGEVVEARLDAAAGPCRAAWRRLRRATART